MASSAPDHLRTPGLISNRPCYEGIRLGPTLQVSSSAELFDAPETAIGFLVWLKEGFQEFEGESIAGGFTLKAFEELTSPQVGSDAFAGNIVVTPPGIPLDVVSYLVSWRVGNLVASVLVTGIAGVDRSSIAANLAQAMDQRIAQFTAGELPEPATPTPVPTPEPTPTPTAVPAPTPTTAPQPATLEFRATDAPAPEGVSEILFTINDVEVNIAGGDVAGGWTTIVSGPQTFDLMQIIGVEELLGTGDLTPGQYNQVRLEVLEVVVTLNDEEIQATVPSGKLRLVGGFDAVAGETTILTLDFDAGRSVVVTGKNRVLIKPTIKLLVRKEGESLSDAEEAASIEPVEEATTPTPEPAATSVPIATATPEPTATPTPTPVPEVTRDDLPGMVIVEADVESALPGLGLFDFFSGFVGSDELANGTLDPEDTGADIAARGRLDGFSSEFKEPTGINSVSASADLFETEEQARAYLDLQIQDLQVLVGTDIQEGVTLTNFQQTTPPQVGDAAVAGTITFSIPSAGLTLTQTLVSWHRGEVVGTVSAGTFGPEDRTAATDELAQRMDELILAALP